MPAELTVARTCRGCGAQVEFPPDGVSARCSYCGSPLVDEGRSEQHFDAVAPFRIDRSVAQQRIKAHLASKVWAPRSFRRLDGEGRRLRGVLVPFYAHRGCVRSEYRARVGIWWYRTETYQDAKGKTRTRTKRETEWFPLAGTAARAFEDHLVSASRGLAEPEANALEPFDLGWALPMDPRLLSGWEAELPSVTETETAAVVEQELRDAESHRLQFEFLPGDENRLESLACEVELEGRRLVLLPVWVATVARGRHVVRLLVNGQTGRCVGDVPVSPLKVALAVVAAAAMVVFVAWLVRGGA